jgi:hypothetical protein
VFQFEKISNEEKSSMQTPTVRWIPDESIFDLVEGTLRGILRVKHCLSAAGVDTAQIVTSRDAAIASMEESLRTQVVPSGFEQYQLPILLSGENAMYFITTGQPFAEFPRHSHSKSAGLRLIIQGSIIYDGKELVSGDWLYVPRGCSYEFRAGQHGCSIFHVYEPPPSTEVSTAISES